MPSFPSRADAEERGRAEPLGAYGLELHGVREARSLLLPVEPGSPLFHLERCIGAAGRRGETVTDDRAQLRLRSGGEIVIHRRERRAVFTVPHPISDSELVHPYLAPAAAVISRWLGRESFHGAAFAHDGGVWGLLGERESGKSSTVAWLALSGADVVCDDMLILDGDAALPGPRSVDLRPEAARSLGTGEPLGVVGARERWRLEVPAMENRLPLRGWVFLEWANRLEAAEISPSERLVRLFHHRGVRLPPTDPVALLELASLPAWELRRPRGLDSVGPSAERLLALAAE